MKETAYAFSVAKIRVFETKLLTSQELSQLISASDYEKALLLLRGKGLISESGDTRLALKNQMAEAWELLNEIAPDKALLEFLVVKNDFHNLKAALKAFVSQSTGQSFFVTPSVVSGELISAAVASRDYSELPDYLKEAAETTFDVLVRTMDGQLADIILDKLTLDYISHRAQMSGIDFIVKLAEISCVSANIKTAYRAALTGKDEQFLNTALCETKALSKEDLIAAALKGSDELLKFLLVTSYSGAAEALKVSLTAFEKWCDDVVMTHIEKCKYKSFGVEPLIAYYIAKETEVKAIRVVLSCKRNGIDAAAIRERVGKLYV